jgi:uncharacterized membrane protein (DUF2068 family)
MLGGEVFDDGGAGSFCEFRARSERIVAVQGPSRSERSIGVRIIAFGKSIQTTVALAVGAIALLFVDLASPAALQRWISLFAPETQWLHELAQKLASAGDRKLVLVGAVTLAYAAVFAVETVGLWLQKTWAEYLTVIVTSSYLPYEIYGLTKKFTVAKVVTIVLNSAVVIYLIIRIVMDRKARRTPRKTADA